MKNFMVMLLGKIALLFGCDVARKQSSLERNLNIEEKLGYDFEDEAVECIKLVRGNTMLSKRRLVTLYQQVVYCETNNVRGAYVECGVWKGGAVGMMAMANLRHGKERRHIHLFDAFEEICAPDAAVDGKKALSDVLKFTGRDDLNKGQLQPIKGIYDSFGGPGTLAENKKLMNLIGYDQSFLHYHVGWFQNTVPKDHGEIGDIAILRLDGDWYASTKICLESLYSKVVPGGVIIIDDYGTYEGCRLAVDQFIEREQLRVYLSSVDRDCRYWIKR